MPEHYADRLAAAITARGTAAVVGIDPVVEKLPPDLRPDTATAAVALKSIERFARTVLERVAPLVPAVKINSGFFEAYHAAGVALYYHLVKAAHAEGLLVIGDIKRGDIGSTAQFYARGHLATPALEDLEPETIPDAVTLAGYLGHSAVAPFVEFARLTGRGVYVLVRPSDPGADEVHEFGGATPFYEHLAGLVSAWGADADLLGSGGLSCVGAVVAPKDTTSTAALRAQLPHTPLLVPGYGAQGADAAACRACFSATRGSAVVNASRSVIYAFGQDEYRARYGDDWAGAVAAAAGAFAGDIGRLIAPGGAA